jgi:septal ring-binding cell division protein DamX
METPPPPDASVPPQQPVERRCPRCGSTLAADQEWCLNCGAAAQTEVVEARGWRVPLYLGGGLAALAVIGVILAIVALASRNDVVAGPTPTPSAAAPPASTASPLPTLTPLPSTTASPSPTTSPDPNATTTPDPNATASPSPTESPTAEPTTTPDDSGNTGSGEGSTGTGSFPGWTGADGDYTIIIESAKSTSQAEKVAQKAQDAGHSDVGILNSSDYSSLNGGYQVVFVGTYSSKSEAQDALSDVRSDFKDAYVRQIKS